MGRRCVLALLVVVLAALSVVPAAAAASSASKKPLFNPSRSRSLARPFWGQTFNTHLARGASLNGWVAKEMVSIGPYSAEIVLGGIQQDSGLCPESEPLCSGVLGLGFYNNSATGVRRSLVPQLSTPTSERGASSAFHRNKKPSPLRGVPMPHSFVALVLTPGPCELQLGGFRPESIVPYTLQGIPVTPSCPTCKGEQMFSRWEVPIVEIRLGSFVLAELDDTRHPHGSSSDVTSGIIDVAYSFIALPFDIYETFSQAWNFTVPSQQTLLFTFGSVSYTVRKESLCSAGGLTRLPANTTCNPVFVVPSTGPHLILGDPFLRAVVTMFDVTNTTAPVLGIAQRNESYIPHVEPANITLSKRSSSARHSLRSVLPIGGVSSPPSSSPPHPSETNDADDDAAADDGDDVVLALRPLHRRHSTLSIPDFYHHTITVPVPAVSRRELAARWVGAGGSHLFAALVASAPREFSRLPGGFVYSNSSTASVSMTQVGQLAYFINITIGTPRQGPFVLQIDSFTPLTAVRASQVGLPYSTLTMICALAFFSLFLCGGVILVGAYVCVRSRKPSHAVAWLDTGDHAHDALLNSAGRPGSPDGEWYEEIIYTAE